MISICIKCFYHQNQNQTWNVYHTVENHSLNEVREYYEFKQPYMRFVKGSAIKIVTVIFQHVLFFFKLFISLFLDILHMSWCLFIRSKKNIWHFWTIWKFQFFYFLFLFFLVLFLLFFIIILFKQFFLKFLCFLLFKFFYFDDVLFVLMEEIYLLLCATWHLVKNTKTKDNAEVKNEGMKIFKMKSFVFLGNSATNASIETYLVSNFGGRLRFVFIKIIWQVVNFENHLDD